MQRKFNPTSVGIFVISALILFILSGILLFNDKFFQKTIPFVLYFDSSMNGLDIGSAVKFKGVNIGTVKSIDIAYDANTKVVLTPVTIDLNFSVFSTSSELFSKSESEEFYRRQITSGLAAKLSMDSIITGKLFVELDYYSPNKVRFYGANKTKLVQIPTVKSEIEKFISSADNVLKGLSKIDFELISKKISSILSRVDDQLKKANLTEMVHNFSSAASEVRSFFVSNDVKLLIENASNAMSNISNFVEDFGGVAKKLEEKIGTALVSISSSSKQFNKTCEYISSLIAPESDLRQNIKEFLLEMTKTVDSLRNLLDLLNKSPNAILTGIEYEN